MALELRQQLKLAQRLVMTPQLRQAIKLLQLNHLELSGALQAELEKNPALEEGPPPAEIAELPPELAANLEKSGPSLEENVTKQVEIGDKIEEVNWENYANNFDSNFSFSYETPAADAPSQFDFISEKPGLLAYLQWQLAHSELEEKEMEVALYIAGNLNRNGFLEVSRNEIVIAMESDVDEVEYVLEVVQDLDPPGIAARDVSESLYLQLERMGKEESLAAEIVRDHLSLLEVKNYKELARVTGKKRNDVVRAVDFITSKLTPFPGLPYAVDATNYIIPDVYVLKVDGEYIIRLNDDDIPNLRLTDDYVKMLECKDEQGKLEKDSRSYVTEKVKSAEWFIKSLYQRQRTIYKVMESILKFQKDFFERGPAYLKPLILKDVAEDIDMHESTISRVTSNKYTHTPQGIYELKYFFSTAIPRDGKEALAAESIKTRIRRMIQEEDKTKPLSDSAISNKLAEQSIKIARRTVAKYREQMKILPVKHRRQSK